MQSGCVRPKTGLVTKNKDTFTCANESGIVFNVSSDMGAEFRLRGRTLLQIRPDGGFEVGECEVNEKEDEAARLKIYEAFKSWLFQTLYPIRDLSGSEAQPKG